MYKFITATIMLLASFVANSSIILNTGESFSSAFSLISDGAKFKETDFFWDVVANISIVTDTTAELTLTLYEDTAGTNQVLSSSDSYFFDVPNTPFSSLIDGGDTGLFTDFDGSFTLKNTGISQIELFEVTISNFAGILDPSNVATATIVPSAVPLPAAAWLMLSGIGALGLIRRKRK